MGSGTGIGRVRGLGSAHSGTHHWWHQRLTGATNLLLVTWAVASLFRLPLHNYRAMVLWLGSPWVSVPLILATVSVFYHMRLGLQVFIEDYLHDFSRIAALVLLNLFTIGGGALAVFAILKVALLPGALS
jgi:succinate dehydrogenase / fumarate reductase membrane anchor subunit